METIYEAFTSGKEVRRENGRPIMAMGRCDWMAEGVTNYAIDDQGYASYHDESGIDIYSLDFKGNDLIVIEPDPRDEVIKAAEVWYEQMNLFLERNPEALLSKESKAVLAAIENLRKNRDNGL